MGNQAPKKEGTLEERDGDLSLLAVSNESEVKKAQHDGDLKSPPTPVRNESEVKKAQQEEVKHKF